MLGSTDDNCPLVYEVIDRSFLFILKKKIIEMLAEIVYVLMLTSGNLKLKNNPYVPALLVIFNKYM